MGIKSYRDLVVWQKSMELVTDVYAITNGFPKEEIYAITSQIRRSAVSVPSNFISLSNEIGRMRVMLIKKLSNKQ